MVFANLSTHEKDAFFSLLDEYFASRPELFNSAGSGASDIATAAAGSTAGRAAASAIHNAFSNSTASQDSEAPIPRWKKPGAANTSPSNSDISSSLGRVAAAAKAFNFNPGAPPASSANRGGDSPPATAPRPPPRRATSNNSDSDSPSLQSRGSLPTTTGMLVKQRKFGDVDMSSGKNMYSSIRNSTANKSATPPAVAPPIPAAFPPKQRGFGPPPMRRVTSSSSKSELKSVSPAPPPPAPPRRKEPEPEGEWAEALYDYTSEDPDDLPLEEGQKVLVVDRTSSDEWWVGESDGQRGSFPAAYVKLV